MRTGFVVLTVFLMVGCSSIPPDVVELSDKIGRDMEAVHASYHALIETHFDGLRGEVDEFADNRWRPKFLKRYIEETGLVALVQAGSPDLPETMSIWADEAIRQIDLKRAKLLEPVDASEAKLLAAVDGAFAQILRGNATITGHLSSLRNVKEAQDRALEALEIDDLRDTVNDGLIRASELAASGIVKLAKAEQITVKAGEFKGKVGDAVRRELNETD